MGMFDFLKRNEDNELRDSVEMLYKEGMKASDIASALNISLGRTAAFLKPLQKPEKKVEQNLSQQATREKSEVQIARENVEIMKLKVEQEQWLKKYKDEQEALTLEVRKVRLEGEVQNLEQKKRHLEEKLSELEEDVTDAKEEHGELLAECDRVGLALEGGEEDDPMKALFSGLLPQIVQKMQNPSSPAPPTPQETQYKPVDERMPDSAQQTLTPSENVAPEAANEVTETNRAIADRIWPNIPEQDKKRARELGKAETWKYAQLQGIKDRAVFEILWKRINKEAT